MQLKIFTFFLLFCRIFSAPEAERVLLLPGWDHALPSNQYSGFVDASADGKFKMHYWFVEAELEPENKPLILWFNGGPGASSLYGLLVELGPFILSDLSYQGPSYAKTSIPQLIYNTNGWQKIGNILALSMPPPVGFSYCEPVGPPAQGNDCGAWNDTTTADVTYYAIKSWLKSFPEFRKNKMYITGESYAGVYVPMIVKNVLNNPDDGMNLVGFAVGDACTPPDICGDKQIGPYWAIQFLYGKGAFSNKLYEQINDICSRDELYFGNLSDDCNTIVSAVESEVGGYWVYGYYDTCWYENDIRRNKLRNLLSMNTDTSIKQERPYYGPPIKSVTEKVHTRRESAVEARTGTSWVGGNGYPCGGPSAQVDWLSRPEVRSALHIPSDAVFFQCDNGYDFTYELTEKDLVSWYKDTIASNKLKVMVYNGDTDPCINSFQAQNWTRSLGFKEQESWRGWTLDGCQSMAGYVTRYENNFDFVTIKGSGHMVPLDRPQAALEMMKRFVNNENFQTFDGSCVAP